MPPLALSFCSLRRARSLKTVGDSATVAVWPPSARIPCCSVGLLGFTTMSIGYPSIDVPSLARRTCSTRMTAFTGNSPRLRLSPQSTMTGVTPEVRASHCACQVFELFCQNTPGVAAYGAGVLPVYQNGSVPAALSWASAAASSAAVGRSPVLANTLVVPLSTLSPVIPRPSEKMTGTDRLLPKPVSRASGSMAPAATAATASGPATSGLVGVSVAQAPTMKVARAARIAGHRVIRDMTASLIRVTGRMSRRARIAPVGHSWIWRRRYLTRRSDRCRWRAGSRASEGACLPGVHATVIKRSRAVI